MMNLPNWVDRFFDLLFLPFRSIHPLYALGAAAIVCALLLLVAFRFTSDQRSIRRAKDRLEAQVLVVRLFPDQLGTVVRAYGRLLLAVLVYLRHTIRPLLVAAIPLVIVFVQLDAHFARVPAQPAEDFILKARLTEGTRIDQVALALPEGMKQTAPALRIAPENEVDWRLQAERAGEYRVEVRAAGQTHTKQVVAGGSLPRLAWKRVQGGFLRSLLYPGEAPLPAGGAVEWIEVVYRPRTFRWGFETDWLIPFLLVMLVATLALKGVVRTEI